MQRTAREFHKMWHQLCYSYYEMFVIAQCVIWNGNAGDKTPENFLDFGFFVQEQSHTEEKSMENDHSSLWLCFFYLVIFCFKIPNFIILIQSH